MSNFVKMIRWGVPLVLVALMQMPVGAQTKDHLGWLFGTKKADAPAPKGAAKPHAAEVSIELAWLADPGTFPYFLEAHSDGAKIEVTGYVPSKAVRDRAVNLAKLYTSLPVVDAMTENTSLVIRPAPSSSKELQATVTTALRETFPSSYTRFDVQCYPDGKVEVSGAVSSVEEKLVLSQTLRRQHGSTSVVNLTHVQGESVAQSTPPASLGSTVAKKAAPSAEKTAKDNPPAPSSPFSLASIFGRATPKKTTETASAKPAIPKREAPAAAKAETPAEDSAIVPVSSSTTSAKSESKAPETTKVTAASMLKLKKTIEQACPGARPVQVTQSASGAIKLDISARTTADVDHYAEQILSLPELQSYRFDLNVHVTETATTK